MSLGCGSGDTAPLRSVPVEPTVSYDFGETVKWVGMQRLLAKGVPGFPVPVSELALGMPGPAAVAVLDSARDPRLVRPATQEIKGRRVVGGSLVEYPEVGVTLIIDTESDSLHEVDISLPTDQALYLFTEAWGEPAMHTDSRLGPTAVWLNPALGMRIEMVHAEQRLSLAKFRREPHR